MFKYHLNEGFWSLISKSPKVPHTGPTALTASSSPSPSALITHHSLFPSLSLLSLLLSSPSPRTSLMNRREQAGRMAPPPHSLALTPCPTLDSFFMSFCAVNTFQRQHIRSRPFLPRPQPQPQPWRRGLKRRRTLQFHRQGTLRPTEHSNCTSN